MTNPKLELTPSSIKRCYREIDFKVKVKPKLDYVRLEATKPDTDKNFKGDWIIKYDPDETIAEEDGTLFHFRIVPPHLPLSEFPELSIKFYLEAYSSSETEYYEKTFVENLKLVNPFKKREARKEKMDLQATAPAKEELLMCLNQFILEQTEPVGFIIGAPGVGKTTLLEQWREWVYRQETPPPLIAIVRSEFNGMVEESSLYFPMLVHSTDKAILESLQNSNEVGHIYLKEFRSISLLSADNDQQEERKSKRLQKELGGYISNPVNCHTVFINILGKVITNLVNHQTIHNQAVFVIDDSLIWESQSTGHLLTCLNSYFQPLSWGTITPRVILILPSELEVLLANDRQGIVFNNPLLAEFEIFSPGKSLRLDGRENGEDLNILLAVQEIRHILDKSLPLRWFHWWGDSEVEYLWRLSGGNPQAIQAILYEWWELFRAFDPPDRYVDKGECIKECVMKSNKKIEIGIGSLRELWKEYWIIATRGLSNDIKKLIKYLVELCSVPNKTLNMPLQGVPKSQWYQNTKDAHVVKRLYDIGLVTEQDHRVRLSIPALCVSVHMQAEDYDDNPGE